MSVQRKLYIVTDLGPGDGGKGGVVHKISSMTRAHTIVKVGGAQGSHGVVTSHGDRFAFSQFGCGTFEGARTHLSSRFIVSPEGLLNEARALRYDCGIIDVFNLLTVDQDALCATPFHGIASRLKELARGVHPRGTIGTGVGEAYRDALRYPDLIICAGDLSSSNLRDRLGAVRDRISIDLAPVIEGGFLSEDQSRVAREVELLRDPGFLEYVVQRFQEAATCVRVVDREMLRTILARDGVVVVESSHGVLTDHYQGFHPHTSAIRTLPRFTREMIEAVGYDGHIVSVGVARAYQIRHGAGPMPTAEEVMGEDLLPGSYKEENRYQGKVRVGPLDLVLLRYALAAAGGPDMFQGLAVTWFDQIQRNGGWSLCDEYQSGTDARYFTSSREIRIRTGDDDTQLVYQEELGRCLQNCAPHIETHRIASGSSREDLYGLCAGVLGERLHVPVRMISFGPTERDKVCR